MAVVTYNFEKHQIDQRIFMKKQNKKKIINDPVLGFINIHNDLLFDIIQHPYFQRLGRIKQLGLTSIVYPGAQHTRLQHSLGSMHLMSEAIQQLRHQGLEITHAEAEAARACILLHDIGHGPFSHALEQTVVTNVHHEQISLWMMELINKEMNNRLEMAIQIFKNQYHKKFLHQLVSSQLDVDRLDYLSRDSFYSGVSEGVIGAARIIKMLNVHDDKLVVDAKGIYSIEKFLIARRLMYWQVYLHKTAVAAEKMLINILTRAKELANNGMELFGSPALKYFLYQNIGLDDFNASDGPIHNFSLLDDSDIICAIKVWMECPDKVLSLLCQSFTNRKLFKVEIHQQPLSNETIESHLAQYQKTWGISKQEAGYFIDTQLITTDTYNNKADSINILYKDGTIKDIADASDMLNIGVLTKKVEKYYFFYYKL
jgi:uncharacterized protein